MLSLFRANTCRLPHGGRGWKFYKAAVRLRQGVRGFKFFSHNLLYGDQTSSPARGTWVEIRHGIRFTPYDSVVSRTGDVG